MARELTESDIRIISISVPESVPTGRPEDAVRVKFKAGDIGPEFQVLVWRNRTADENIVKVARHYLHLQMKEIAAATAPWKLTEDEIEKVVSTGKTLSKNRTTLS